VKGCQTGSRPPDLPLPINNLRSGFISTFIPCSPLRPSYLVLPFQLSHLAPLSLLPMLSLLSLLSPPVPLRLSVRTFHSTRSPHSLRSLHFPRSRRLLYSPISFQSRRSPCSLCFPRLILSLCSLGPPRSFSWLSSPNLCFISIDRFRGVSRSGRVFPPCPC
jgi:hypothetical protein